MFKIEVIGHLGGDVEIKEDNGRKYAQFSVADTKRYKDTQGREVETTNWVSCFFRNVDSPVLQYLVKGVRVYVRGNGELRLFSSAKDRMMKAGASINVTDIEIVSSGSTDAVPRELVTSDGRLWPVNKHYHVVFEEKDKKINVLYDKRGKPYNVDKNGFVTPVPIQQSDSSTNKPENADGSPVEVY